jgi:hypothetical protein
MLTEDEIRQKVNDGKFFLSLHALVESAADEITYGEICHVLLVGSIIEEYPDDPRGESCFVNGQLPDDRYLHVVVGRKQDNLVGITTYIPTLPKWLSPTQRARRE